jgi:hypothetical protein
MKEKTIMYNYVLSYSKKNSIVNINSKIKGNNSGNSHTRVMNLVTQHVCNDKKYIFEVLSTLKSKEVIISLKENP